MVTPAVPGLPDRLRQARERRGLTQRSAARILGCSRIWLSRLERNDATLSAFWLYRLAPVYLVSADWLLFGVTDPAPK